MDKPFQRKGAKNNTEVGHDFEKKVQDFFARRGLSLTPKFEVPVGINGKKPHNFDLGNKKVLVECKAHKWTEGGHVPSGKLKAWNEAMFLFYGAPRDYRKIFIVQKDFSSRKGETLCAYYVRTYSHLIPRDVELWEYDERTRKGKQVK